MIIWYWSVKGGTGTSVVAGATAIRLAAKGNDTILVDLVGDQPSLLGLTDDKSVDSEPGISDWIAAGDDVAADAIARLLENVASNLRLLPKGKTSILPDNTVRGGTHGSEAIPNSSMHRLMLALDMLSLAGPVVVDAGLDPHRGRSVLPDTGKAVCVLRACYLALSQAQQIPGPYDQIVLVQEPGRALRARDVVRAVGGSEVECVNWDPRVARSVDAGTLVSLLPPPLRRFKLPT
ncbi:MAG: hypothetical protein OXI96_00295 [Acidimicrobiaceae bacterium]|nr:hypothetical protein [Acidimicrobiaceae bacterium]